jgi:hypothetical protein
VLANVEEGMEGAGVGEVLGGRDGFDSTPQRCRLDDATESAQC